jgi:hypothetical protein
VHLRLLEKSVRILVTILLGLLLSIAVGCGSSSPAPTPYVALQGNWQFNLAQADPLPATTLSVSGFLQSQGATLTGSVSVPSDPSGNCGGVVSLTGTQNSQNVNFSIDQNGTVLSFTGTIGSDVNSMSGTYAGPAGTCFNKPTSGTWTAVSIPPVNGAFTGNLANSQYMTVLTGLNPPKPIPVSGTLTQSASADGSNASVTGTITATGYPCFNTATLVGTVSGQNLVLAVYSYAGEQIGSLGTGAAPLTVSSSTTGISLSGLLTLGGIAGSGQFGPCPAIENGLVEDFADACFVISSQPEAVCTPSSAAALRRK